jgi:hypothetical protein
MLLLKDLILEYTGGESTSIRTETAERLFNSIYYTLDACISSIDDAMEALAILKKLHIVDIYHQGAETIKVCVDQTESMLKRVGNDRLGFGTEAYQLLFDDLSLFFKNYDIRFGRLSGSSLVFEAAYGEARRALQAARASVFCLDVTDADSHTLEAGLEMTAEDTGGFFARTNLFSGLAMHRLAGALAGHYVLFVEVTSPSDKRWHQIEVDLARRPGTVLAKRHYVGTP